MFEWQVNSARNDGLEVHVKIIALFNQIHESPLLDVFVHELLHF